jgi:hypothetical protein
MFRDSATPEYVHSTTPEFLVLRATLLPNRFRLVNSIDQLSKPTEISAV